MGQKKPERRCGLHVALMLGVCLLFNHGYLLCQQSLQRKSCQYLHPPCPEPYPNASYRRWRYDLSGRELEELQGANIIHIEVFGMATPRNAGIRDSRTFESADEKTEH